jgi:hypothetical protein
VEAWRRFSGNVDASVTEETIFEIKQWVERGWHVPVGRFKFSSLGEGGRAASRELRWSMMRTDAAVAWRDVMREAGERGATLAEPYGDTLRPLGFAKKDGTSRRSFHICGRAVDVNQRLAQGPGQRYYLTPEESEGRMYFRLRCRAAKQDGTQGQWFRYGDVPCWRAYLRGELYLPEGWYVDLTELLESARFERVHAQEGWEQRDVRSEWWHYHYSVDTQLTFLDECELVGIGERKLLAAGYSIEEMDRRPG